MWVRFYPHSLLCLVARHLAVAVGWLPVVITVTAPCCDCWCACGAGLTGWTPKAYCREVSNGQPCKYGDSCKYSHDIASLLASKPPDIGASLFPFDQERMGVR